MLASALALCHFDYAISSWYCGLNKKLKRKLQVSQNKVLRFILNLKPLDHIGALEFKAVGILNIEMRAKQIRLHHMYSIFNDNCPDYLKTYITRVQSRHTYNTRTCQVNFIPPQSNNYVEKTFYYNAINDWNYLTSNVKEILSKHSFKYVIKRKLLDSIEL
jgi:hypothetical protein